MHHYQSPGTATSTTSATTAIPMASVVPADTTDAKTVKLLEPETFHEKFEKITQANDYVSWYCLCPLTTFMPPAALMPQYGMFDDEFREMFKFIQRIVLDTVCLVEGIIQTSHDDEGLDMQSFRKAFIQSYYDCGKCMKEKNKRFRTSQKVTSYGHTDYVRPVGGPATIFTFLEAAKYIVRRMRYCMNVHEVTNLYKSEGRTNDVYEKIRNACDGYFNVLEMSLVPISRRYYWIIDQDE
jgi:hypothetical protein